MICAVSLIFDPLSLPAVQPLLEVAIAMLLPQLLVFSGVQAAPVPSCTCRIGHRLLLSPHHCAPRRRPGPSQSGPLCGARPLRPGQQFAPPPATRLGWGSQYSPCGQYQVGHDCLGPKRKAGLYCSCKMRHVPRKKRRQPISRQLTRFSLPVRVYFGTSRSDQSYHSLHLPRPTLCHLRSAPRSDEHQTRFLLECASLS